MVLRILVKVFKRLEFAHVALRLCLLAALLVGLLLGSVLLEGDLLGPFEHEHLLSDDLAV